jgi:hypothetical protein
MSDPPEHTPLEQDIIIRVVRPPDDPINQDFNNTPGEAVDGKTNEKQQAKQNDEMQELAESSG